MAKCSEADHVRFIDFYAGHPCLWNPNDAYYKDRKVRDKALMDIAEKMNVACMKTTRDVTYKIKNLRSTYCQELKKIETSEKLKEHIYKPKIPWFPVMHKCLRPFMHRRTETYIPYDTIEVPAIKPEPTHDPLDTIADFFGAKDDDEDDDNDDAEDHDDDDSYEAPPPKRKTRKRTTRASTPKPASRPAASVAATIAAAPTPVMSAEVVTKDGNDQFDVFGNYVAMEMRNLRNEYLRRKMKRKIQQLIVEIGEEEEHILSLNS